MKRRPWTDAEDVTLKRLVAQYGDKRGRQGRWEDITKSIPGRTKKDCRKRWFHSIDPSVRKGRWTAEEDKLLLENYDQFGPAWKQIALAIPGRKDDQCSKRYGEILDPSARDRLRKWTPAEDKQLAELVDRMGSAWRAIATNMAGRTALTCRNRWRRLNTKSNNKQIAMPSILSSIQKARAAALQQDVSSSGDISEDASTSGWNHSNSPSAASPVIDPSSLAPDTTAIDLTSPDVRSQSSQIYDQGIHEPRHTTVNHVSTTHHDSVLSLPSDGQSHILSHLSCSGESLPITSQSESNPFAGLYTDYASLLPIDEGIQDSAYDSCFSDPAYPAYLFRSIFSCPGEETSEHPTRLATNTSWPVSSEDHNAILQPWSLPDPVDFNAPALHPSPGFDADWPLGLFSTFPSNFTDAVGNIAASIHPLYLPAPKKIHVLELVEPWHSRTISCPEPISFMGFHQRGGYIVCYFQGIAIVGDNGEWKVLRQVIPDHEKHLVRLNDGAIDSRGRLWFGSIDLHGSGLSQAQVRSGEYYPAGCIYCYSSDGALTVHEKGGIFCSNGIGWAPDDRTMVFTDSTAKVRTTNTNNLYIFSRLLRSSSGRMTSMRLLEPSPAREYSSIVVPWKESQMDSL
ncbi:MAG: hypothetical protein M1819_007334 [Sarea resinae]|nr:MAG: hypothetical protein M1819_007334 [Sarea resinae]